VPVCQTSWLTPLTTTRLINVCTVVTAGDGGESKLSWKASVAFGPVKNGSPRQVSTTLPEVS
jgi:hypothetical protein